MKAEQIQTLHPQPGDIVMASGVTLLQVAANPLIASLGKPEDSSFRLNLSQAFNSLGTTVAPTLGGILILSGTVLTVAG